MSIIENATDCEVQDLCGREGLVQGNHDLDELEREPQVEEIEESVYPGLLNKDLDDILRWAELTRSYAARFHETDQRTRLFLEAADPNRDPKAIAGCLLSMGKKEEFVIELFIEDPLEGSSVRKCVRDACDEFEKALTDRVSKSGGRSGPGAHGAPEEAVESPRGFFKKFSVNEELFDEDRSGTKTKVDLEFLNHVRHGLAKTSEERKAQREFELSNPMTKELLGKYYLETSKTTRFHEGSLVKINSRAGDALIKGAAKPLPKGVTPGAMDKVVEHDCINPKTLSKEDESKDVNLRDQQRLMRNLTFRFAAPLHSKICDLIDKCDNGALLSEALVPLASYEGEPIDSIVEGVNPASTVAFLQTHVQAQIVDLADELALLLHALCTKDLTLQKESLLLNEKGDKKVVQEVYEDEAKPKQKAKVSDENRKKLDPGPQAKAMLAAAVEFHEKSSKAYLGKRKASVHRTPPQDKSKNFRRAPEAPRKPFRRPVFERLDSGKERQEQPPPKSHYLGRGRGGGRGAAGGRGSASKQQWGVPGRE